MWRAEMDRKNNFLRKLIVMALGAVLGMTLFFVIPLGLGHLYTQSMYNRNPMEDYLWENVYGDLMITDALTELTIVSYSMEA
jgi:hypothetical protein